MICIKTLERKNAESYFFFSPRWEPGSFCYHWAGRIEILKKEHLSNLYKWCVFIRTLRTTRHSRLCGWMEDEISVDEKNPKGAFVREVTGTFSWLLYIMISRGTRSPTSSIASPGEWQQLDSEKAVTYYKPPSVFKYKFWKYLSFTWIFSFSYYFIYFLEAKHCTFYFAKVIS